MGRTRIGWRAGLTPADLWERGRGVWRVNLGNAASADLLVLTNLEGVIVLVGTITGARFIGDRVALDGVPDPHHPLIGQPDPLVNTSTNPVRYGQLVTVPATPPTSAAHAPQVRSYDELLASASSVLTEAAQLQRERFSIDASGRIAADPSSTEPIDWAEFVTLALAGAAANAGGIEAALRGRPGSWEAAGVRSLLEQTVGADQSDLWRHRTTPVLVHVDVDDVAPLGALYDPYEAAAAELEAQEQQRRRDDPEPDSGPFVWAYDLVAGADPRPRSDDAPTWSWEAWRASQTSLGTPRAQLAWLEEKLRSGDELLADNARIVKSPDAAAELTRLWSEWDERMSVFDGPTEQLDALQERELAAYREALRERIVSIGQNKYGLTVPIQVIFDRDDAVPAPAPGTLEAMLIETAAANTPTPADLPGTPLTRLGI